MRWVVVFLFSLLTLLTLSTSGCIDVNLAREKLLPREKVVVHYSIEKLVEMEHTFDKSEPIRKVAHFKVPDGTPWISLRYSVVMEDLPAGSPISSAERHFTIKLISDVTGDKILEYSDYVDTTYTKDPPFTVQNPRPGIWSVEVEMYGVYYSGVGGEVQDSFFVYVSGMMPHKEVVNE